MKRKPIGVAIDERIDARAALLEEYETLQAKAHDEDRVFDEDERKRADEIKASVEKINTQLEELGERERLLASSTETTPLPKRGSDSDERYVEAKSARTRERDASDRWKGVGLALQAHCLHAVGGNNHAAAADYARKTLDDHALSKIFEFRAGHTPEEFNRAVFQAAAVDQGTSTDADYLAPLQEYRRAADQFIGLWRSKTILGRLMTTSLSFGVDRDVEIPRMTTGTSTAWVGEGSPIPVSAMAFDSIALEPREMGTIVVMTEKSIRHANPSALMIAQNDMVESAARHADVTALDANTSNPARPRGLFNGVTPITATSGGGYAAADGDAKALIGAMTGNDIPIVGGGWVMSPEALLELQFMRDGNGNLIYPETLNGSWRGYPVIDSSQQTTDTIDFICAGHVIMADDFGPEISLSNEATIHRDDAPEADLNAAATPVQSLWQTAAVGIRVMQGLDWERRRDNVVARITGATWV
jgi:HK97 family phage major capsid protein